MTAAEIETSVIIPFYNEEENVNDTLLAVSKSLHESGLHPWELVLVNDGSTDSTRELLEKWRMRDHSSIIINHERNLGVGGALRSGIAHARGCKLVTIEGDLSYNPSDIVRLLREIEAGYEIVIGSPYAKGGSVKGVPRLRYFISRVGNLLLARSMGLELSCVTNSFRAYRSNIVELIAAVGYNDKRFHPTVLLQAKFAELKITEVPVSLAARRKGISKTRIIRNILTHSSLLLLFLRIRVQNKMAPGKTTIHQ